MTQQHSELDLLYSDARMATHSLQLIFEGFIFPSNENNRIFSVRNWSGTVFLFCDTNKLSFYFNYSREN